MKKKLIAALLAIVCAVCLAFGLAACDLFGGNSNVTKVTLDRDEITLKVNDKDYLTATVSPSNAEDKTVAWAASPSGIVTVVGYEEYCLILGVKEGNAIVTATVGGKKASCRVTVTAADDNPGIDDPDKEIPVESITINKTAIELEVGDEDNLTATVLPENATNKSVTWGVDNPDVVIVLNGKVTAMGEGTAKIVAKAGDKTAICTVTVKAKPIPVVTLDKYTLLLDVGATATLTANGEVEWTSGDTEIASVDNNGNITAIARGTTLITASANGVSATCAVTVKYDGQTATPGVEYGFTSDGESSFVRGIGSATATDIVIASEYEGKPVTFISSGAFNGNKNITSVIIPDSVTTIQSKAFYMCSNLTSVTIGSGVTEIEEKAFTRCSKLESLIMTGNEETVIGQEAFYYCESLISVIISNVKSIGIVAFSGCTGLTHITIGNGLTSLGTNAFDSCSSLTHITYNGTVEQWNAVSKGWLWNYATGVYTLHCTDGDVAKK